MCDLASKTSVAIADCSACKEASFAAALTRHRGCAEQIILPDWRAWLVWILTGHRRCSTRHAFPEPGVCLELSPNWPLARYARNNDAQVNAGFPDSHVLLRTVNTREHYIAHVQQSRRNGKRQRSLQMMPRTACLPRQRYNNDMQASRLLFVQMKLAVLMCASQGWASPAHIIGFPSRP